MSTVPVLLRYRLFIVIGSLHNVSAFCAHVPYMYRSFNEHFALSCFSYAKKTDINILNDKRFGYGTRTYKFWPALLIVVL